MEGREPWLLVPSLPAPWEDFKTEIFLQASKRLPLQSTGSGNRGSIFWMPAVPAWRQDIPSRRRHGLRNGVAQETIRPPGGRWGWSQTVGASGFGVTGSSGYWQFGSLDSAIGGKFRGSKDHTNIGILRSGSQAQGVISESMVCFFMFMWPSGPLTLTFSD